MKKLWRKIWYNTTFRICFIMFPSYFVVLIPFMIWIEVPENIFREILCVIYMLIFAWGVVDNEDKSKGE